MAKYGTGTAGIPFTGFTPTLGVASASDVALSGTVQKNGLSQRDIFFNRILRQGDNAAQQQLLLATIGLVSGGGTAVSNHFLIDGHALPNGESFFGIQPIVNKNRISRVTTGNDQTNFFTMFNSGRAPVPYIEDSGGNGGGGKTGW